MDEKPPRNWTHLGCSIVVGVLLLIGLAKYAMEWLGYLPSEGNFRKATILTVDAVESQGEQVTVRIKLTNPTKWATSAGIECAAIDADGHKLSGRILQVRDVGAGATVERKAIFDRDELAKAGLAEPSAKNFRLSLRWACEAGLEDSAVFR